MDIDSAIQNRPITYFNRGYNWSKISGNYKINRTYCKCPVDFIEQVKLFEI